MLTCKALTQQHASDYLDHALTPRARLGVRVHLMLCRNCRQFLGQLKVVRELLQHRPPPATAEPELQATAARVQKAYTELNKS